MMHGQKNIKIIL